MKTILKILLNAFAVFVLSEFLNGVTINNYITAIVVVLVLSILNVVIKPILILLTLPVTIFTLGLFLFVVNAIIILLADKLIGGFAVNGIWTALLFSVLLSALQSLLHTLIKTDKKS